MVNKRAVSRSPIDLSKLRRRLRAQRKDAIFAMLDDALGLLSPVDLEQLIAPYVVLDELRVEETAPRVNTPSCVRIAVERFVEASRRGDYFETFNVNSKNCTELSNGTVAWIAEIGRMLEQCVASSPQRRGARAGHVGGVCGRHVQITISRNARGRGRAARGLTGSRGVGIVVRVV